MLASSVYVYRRRQSRTSTSVSRDRSLPSSQRMLSVTVGLSLTVTWARKGVTDTSRRHGEKTLGTCLFACCRNDGSRWTTRRRRDRHDRPSNKPFQQPRGRAARPATERRRSTYKTVWLTRLRSPTTTPGGPRDLLQRRSGFAVCLAHHRLRSSITEALPCRA